MGSEGVRIQIQGVGHIWKMGSMVLMKNEGKKDKMHTVISGWLQF